MPPTQLRIQTMMTFLPWSLRYTTLSCYTVVVSCDIAGFIGLNKLTYACEITLKVLDIF